MLRLSAKFVVYLLLIPLLLACSGGSESEKSEDDSAIIDDNTAIEAEEGTVEFDAEAANIKFEGIGLAIIVDSIAVLDNTEVSFTYSLSSADIEVVSTNWVFPDDSTSSENNPSFSFSEIGSNTVNLEIELADGEVLTSSTTLNVVDSAISNVPSFNGTRIGDFDSDSDIDAADLTEFDTLGLSNYSVSQDINIDGKLSSEDRALLVEIVDNGWPSKLTKNSALPGEVISFLHPILFDLSKSAAIKLDDGTVINLQRNIPGYLNFIAPLLNIRSVDDVFKGGSINVSLFVDDVKITVLPLQIEDITKKSPDEFSTDLVSIQTGASDISSRLEQAFPLSESDMESANIQLLSNLDKLQAELTQKSIENFEAILNGFDDETRALILSLASQDGDVDVKSTARSASQTSRSTVRSATSIVGSCSLPKSLSYKQVIAELDVFREQFVKKSAKTIERGCNAMRVAVMKFPALLPKLAPAIAACETSVKALKFADLSVKAMNLLTPEFEDELAISSSHDFISPSLFSGSSKYTELEIGINGQKNKVCTDGPGLVISKLLKNMNSKAIKSTQVGLNTGYGSINLSINTSNEIENIAGKTSVEFLTKILSNEIKSVMNELCDGEGYLVPIKACALTSYQLAGQAANEDNFDPNTNFYDSAELGDCIEGDITFGGQLEYTSDQVITGEYQFSQRCFTSTASVAAKTSELSELRRTRDYSALSDFSETVRSNYSGTCEPSESQFEKKECLHYEFEKTEGDARFEIDLNIACDFGDRTADAGSHIDSLCEYIEIKDASGQVIQKIDSEQRTFSKVVEHTLTLEGAKEHVFSVDVYSSLGALRTYTYHVQISEYDPQIEIRYQGQVIGTGTDGLYMDEIFSGSNEITLELVNLGTSELSVRVAPDIVFYSLQEQAFGTYRSRVKDIIYSEIDLSPNEGLDENGDLELLLPIDGSIEFKVSRVGSFSLNRTSDYQIAVLSGSTELSRLSFWGACLRRMSYSYGYELLCSADVNSRTRDYETPSESFKIRESETYIEHLPISSGLKMSWAKPNSDLLLDGASAIYYFDTSLDAIKNSGPSITVLGFNKSTYNGEYSSIEGFVHSNSIRGTMMPNSRLYSFSNYKERGSQGVEVLSINCSYSPTAVESSSYVNSTFESGVYDHYETDGEGNYIVEERNLTLSGSSRCPTSSEVDSIFYDDKFSYLLNKHLVLPE